MGARTFIDQDQTQVVARRVLLVNLAEGRSEVEAAQEQPDGDRFACSGQLGKSKRLDDARGYLSMASHP